MLFPQVFSSGVPTIGPFCLILRQIPPRLLVYYDGTKIIFYSVCLRDQSRFGSFHRRRRRRRQTSGGPGPRTRWLLLATLPVSVGLRLRNKRIFFFGENLAATSWLRSNAKHATGGGPAPAPSERAPARGRLEHGEPARRGQNTLALRSALTAAQIKIYDGHSGRRGGVRRAAAASTLTCRAVV